MSTTSPAALERPRRLLFGLIGITGILAALVGAFLVPGGIGGSARAATPALSISVVGNHFINGSGQTIRLLGVDVPGTEYACEQGWGYSQFNATQTPTSVAAEIAAWHANAVRVPLNEDCWLGINGQPSYNAGAGAAGYRQFIEAWVQALNADGIYAILDLHWSAPGTNVADGQRPMPDDHSAAFWASVASAFSSNPAVVFDLFNEPFSPQLNRNSADVVSWSCWENGGCPVPVAANGTTPNDSDSYTAVGMQTLVSAIRATGAKQPILLAGLDYSNDLSQWLAFKPTDPDNQLAASFHNYYSAPYYNQTCDQLSCWSTTIASVAAHVPVVTSEFDQGYDCIGPPSTPPQLVNFDNDYMAWADSAGVSYLAWGWWELNADPSAVACTSAGSGGADSYTLINKQGQPVSPDGTALMEHLAALAAAGSTTTPPTTTPPTTPPATIPPRTTPLSTPPPAPPPAPAAAANGYDLVGADGGVFAFGNTTYVGSLPGLVPPVRVNDIVGIVPSRDARGYFLVGADGGVFGFGDTTFVGSLPGLSPPVRVDNIVAIVPTLDDRGYLLVGRDGGVFSFGDAPFLGSLPGLGLHVNDVVGIAAAAGGTGYWVVEADGVVHGFGSARAFGNVAPAGSPISAMAGSPGGRGYWVVTQNGSVFSFGAAQYFGSLPAFHLAPNSPIVSVVPTLDGKGYWLVGRNGAIYAFGDAPSLGSLTGLGISVNDIVGAAPSH